MTLLLFMWAARVVAGIDEGSSRIPSAPLAAEDRCSVKVVAGPGPEFGRHGTRAVLRGRQGLLRGLQ